MPTTTETDYVALALASGKEAFAAACPHLLLLSTDRLLRPARPSRTRPPQKSMSTFETAPVGTTVLDASEERNLLVLPIVKVHDVFPEMITLGRTHNNDLVVEDVTISKFHAYFRIVLAQCELADAGSRNGTWIGQNRLPPKGEPQPAPPGSLLRFGQIRFTLRDPASAWAALRRLGGR